MITGEQGSGKTTLARVLRRLIDPKVDLGAKPKEGRDLMIAARNTWVLGFDNMSFIDGELSDAMCRMATGGGFRARQLFTDEEEVLFSASRPQLLNAIPDGTRAQISWTARSCWIWRPAPIRRGPSRGTSGGSSKRWHRRCWARCWTEFRARCGGSPETQLASKPRMADFARWVEAAALELGFAPGEFLASYEATQTDRTNRERGKWSIRIVPETAQVDDGGDARDAPFSSVGMPPRHMFEGEL
ncbi:MAG TPA: hypothetical protein VNS22_13460 [Geminicoccus sp.]|uniref:hypothetical protein n=1 Tax=Geminicoccus sp. TaxID=2024832 RepID=UPI002C4EEB76|nr:hypothetical protein [Geminicoccus sp.]HWL69375.1 hypothetical protein [Geminicoccus sp.]